MHWIDLGQQEMRRAQKAEIIQWVWSEQSINRVKSFIFTSLINMCPAKHLFPLHLRGKPLAHPQMMKLPLCGPWYILLDSPLRSLMHFPCKLAASLWSHQIWIYISQCLARFLLHIVIPPIIPLNDWNWHWKWHHNWGTPIWVHIANGKEMSQYHWRIPKG